MEDAKGADAKVGAGDIDGAMDCGDGNASWVKRS